jgi:hypothetical protein
LFFHEKSKCLNKQGDKILDVDIVRFWCDDLMLHRIYTFLETTFGPQDPTGFMEVDGRWFLFDGRLSGIGVRLTLIGDQLQAFADKVRQDSKFDRTGTKHSDESKEKMRQAKLGKTRGPYDKNKTKDKGEDNV